jgi:hypothetical protein
MGLGSRIREPEKTLLRIRDPGVQKGPGSWIRNTAMTTPGRSPENGLDDIAVEAGEHDLEVGHGLAKVQLGGRLLLVCRR